jgi:hypothetical protein
MEGWMNRQLTFALGLITLVFGPLTAQSISGRISGVVTDSSGAAIPGAQISVINQGTQVKWSTTSDNNGLYLVTNLPVGTYNVEVEAGGFRKAQQSGYDLTDAGRITADFKLKVGTVTETVLVTAVLGETVNTVSGEIAHTIDAEQVQDLALNGRNYMQLVSLIPGVALLDEDQMALTTSLSVTGQSVNGNRTGTNHLAVDGGMNLDSGSNGSQINNVGVDFIGEVRVQTSAFSAEKGRNSGASINVTTKGGGQQYHGSLFETIRNEVLDAKDYFAPVRPKLRFNDFGWSLGGPVAILGMKKGSLFFFAGQEYKRIRRLTNPSRQTLPTRAERTGDFSGRTNTVIRYPGTTTPVPDKNLRSLMTPDGIAIMKVYDAMEKYAVAYTDTPTTNNSTFQVLNPFDWRQDIVRIDWRPNAHHSVYGRWIHDNYNTIDPFGTFTSSALPTTPTLRNRPGYGPQLGYTAVISRTMVNEAKISTSWNGQRTPLQGTAWMRSTYGFQFPRLFGGNGPYSEGIPDVTINGFASFNGPARVYLLSPTTDISFSDNLTYLRGRHAWKAGIMIIRNRKDQNGRTTYDGSVNFNTSGNTNSTNFSLSDAALGQFRTYSEASSDPVGFFRFTQYEGYVQDSWKVSKRLSVEIGLRFSRFLPTYTSANNIVNFEPARYDRSKAVTVTPAGIIVANSGNPYNGLIRAGDGIPEDQQGRVTGVNRDALALIPTGAPRGLYSTQTLWMPRFSFAYVPFNTSRLVLRGGFGTFHDRVEGNLIFSQTSLPPFSSTPQYENANLANPAGGLASALAPVSINALDPNLKTPMTMTFNFGIQGELKHGYFFDLTYAGNQQRHLIRQPDINMPTFTELVANQAIPSAQRPVVNAIRPYKGFASIRMRLSDSVGSYNALQAHLTKRKGNQIFTASYTWSHALADTSGNGDNPDEWTNRKYNFGEASFDRRQIFVMTYTYRVPFLRKGRGFLPNAFGRWEISGITRAQSGNPLTPTGSSTGITRRSDYVGGEVLLSTDERSKDRWFNTQAFVTAPVDRLGTAGVGTIVGPGLYLWDVSLRKQFQLTEKFRVKFQADGFNLMNHVNFRSLQVSTSNNNIGSLTGSGPARQIQFALRLEF